MEFLKRFLLLSFAFVTFVASAQKAEYEKLKKAFEKSYQKEIDGDISAAIEELMQVYSEDSYELNLRLGWLNYSQGLFVKSKSYYQKAIDMHPFAVEPKFGLVYPEVAIGNWETVRKLYEEILKIAPNNSQALYQMGMIYYGRQEYQAALGFFEKVVNLYPFDYDGLVMLGWTNFQLKKIREANVLFYKALLNKPNGSSALEGIRLIEQ